MAGDRRRSAGLEKRAARSCDDRSTHALLAQQIADMQQRVDAAISGHVDARTESMLSALQSRGGTLRRCEMQIGQGAR